jgi:methyl-accepting chemotaxis protein
MTASQEDAARRAREGNEATAAQMRRQVASAADSHATAIEATQEMLDRFRRASAEMVDKLSSGTATVAAAAGSLQQAVEQMSRVGLDLGTLETQAQKATHDLLRASSLLTSAAQTVGNSIQQLGNASVRFEGVASSAGVEANARRQLLLSLQDVIEQSQAASREFVTLAHEVRKALDTSVEQLGSDVSAVLAGHVRTYQKQLGDSVGSLRVALDQLAIRASRERN